ncbi:MAG: GNAT family N-acetyltransferase [Clostridiales bacterium]|nr:GNAT family N-acetyltransferase [Clostridiales bacterium]
MQYTLFDKIYLKEITQEEFERLTTKDADNFINLQTLLKDMSENGDEKLKKKIEMIRDKLNFASRSFSLYDEEKYIGYVSFSDYASTSPEIQIDIKEGYQHKGIGYKAVHYLTDKLFQERADIEHFIYRVRVENVASTKLIEKLGGEEVPVDKVVASFIRKFRLLRK